MAITKKTAAKKPKSPVKKSVAKSAKAEVRSLRRSPNDTPFLTVKFTNQSLYWLILAVLVIALAGWVVYNSLRIDDIYNQIDAANLSNSTPAVVKKAPVN